MNMDNLIYLILFAIVLPMMYVIMLNNAKVKKNIILGVTIPHTKQNDPRIAEIQKSYRLWLTIVSALLLIPAVAFAFMDSFITVFNLSMSWLLLIIVCPYIVFTVYHRKLKALKTAEGWHGSSSGKMVVDLSAAAVPKKLISAMWFLPALAISLVPVAAALIGTEGWEMVLAYAIDAALVCVFYLIYRLINRQRADVVGGNTAMNLALTRVRRYNWGKMSVAGAWIMAAISILLWLMPNNQLMVMIAVLTLILALIIVSMQTELATRSAQHKLTKDFACDEYVDEDKYWINGMFYYNPDDRHLMKNDRVGINMGVNLARPAGMAITIITLLILLALPFFGYFMSQASSAAISLRIEDGVLISNKYEIALDNIEAIEILDTAPENGIRLFGTSIGDYNSGKFNFDGIGKCSVLFYSDSPPYLLIEADGTTYLLGSSIEGEVEAIFARIDSTN